MKCLEGRLYVRVSAHIYNSFDEYERLAAVIKHLAENSWILIRTWAIASLIRQQRDKNIVDISLFFYVLIIWRCTWKSVQWKRNNITKINNPLCLTKHNGVCTEFASSLLNETTFHYTLCWANSEGDFLISRSQRSADWPLRRPPRKDDSSSLHALCPPRGRNQW